MCGETEALAESSTYEKYTLKQNQALTPSVIIAQNTNECLYAYE